MILKGDILYNPSFFELSSFPRSWTSMMVVVGEAEVAYAVQGYSIDDVANIVRDFTKEDFSGTPFWVQRGLGSWSICNGEGKLIPLSEGAKWFPGNILIDVMDLCSRAKG